MAEPIHEDRIVALALKGCEVISSSAPWSRFCFDRAALIEFTRRVEAELRAQRTIEDFRRVPLGGS